jgi:malonyl CoA-acyl carrier protein transacylase
MGGDLFPKYAHLVKRADAVLGYSIVTLCLEGPPERLADTRYTQPALFIVSALSYLERVKQTGVVPDYVAGHSVGEFNALFAAGAFDFLTGLELVKERAALMAQMDGGGMAAVLGMSVGRLRELLAEHGFSSIDIANYNAPEQTVISGPKDDVMLAKQVLERSGARMVVPLKVSGAFHSRYMAPVEAAFARHLSSYRFSRLKIPVISNLEGTPYPDTSITENLVKQLSHPVQWMQSLLYLAQQPSPEFHEIGTERMLTNLIKQIFEGSNAS